MQEHNTRNDKKTLFQLNIYHIVYPKTKLLLKHNTSNRQ